MIYKTLALDRIEDHYCSITFDVSSPAWFIRIAYYTSEYFKSYSIVMYSIPPKQKCKISTESKIAHSKNYYMKESASEMCIWSILLIKSDIKWCIHLSRSLFLYFNYLVSVTAGGPESPRGHM